MRQPARFLFSCVPTRKTDLTSGDRMLICSQSSVPLELAIRSELKKGEKMKEINFTAPRGGVLGSLGPKKGRPKGRGIYPP